ncbi:MAG: DUF4838 domain-containing protein [Clostridia bacterium]|nr:DUF4838 domain-containing protein [Clostridia bacterium]
MRTNRFLCFFMALTLTVSAFCFPKGLVWADAEDDDVPTETLYFEDVDAVLKEDSFDEEGIKDFVTRMYRVCLDRAPDEIGLYGWTEELIEKRATGCSVAYGFIFSPEFQSKQATDSQYISYMYDAFFGRKPDTDGFNYWVDLLGNGMSREAVFCGFANSLEFSELCSDYGVVRGYHIEGTDYNKTAMVNLFVERLYNVVLNRTCDDAGMASWTMQLVDHTLSGCEVAYGFVFSPEFLNLTLCNNHYVEVLYEAFLGRQSDESGKNYWISKLESGSSRETVFNGFAGSVEFAAICDAYGIEAGSIDITGAGTHESGTCTRCEEEADSGSTTPSNEPSGNSTGNGNSAPGVSIGNGSGSSANSGSSNNGGSNGTNGSTSGSNNTPSNTPSKTPTGPANTGNPTVTPTVPGEPTTPGGEPANVGGISAYKNSPYTENMGTSVIVIPDGAGSNSREYYAAALVQLAIERLDKYTPDIITDATAQGSTGKLEISIGNTNRPHGTAKYSSSGSYSIKSYDNGVSITGVGRRGLIDGSVYFLQLCGGYFWLDWEDGMMTHQDCFKYSSEIDYDYKRAFKFTDCDLNYYDGRDDENRMYSLYFGLNGNYANFQMTGLPGGQKWYLSKNGNYDGLQPGHVHTLHSEYFTEEDLKKHPDWFAKGQSSDTPWKDRQMCTTNAEVYDRIKQHVFDLLDDPNVYDPYAEMQIISISQSDNGDICHCDNCKKFRQSHYQSFGAYQNNYEGEMNAALYLDLCNKISQEIKAKGQKENKDYSNVYVDMLAYVQNKMPPKGMTVDDHVIIRFAPIERCYTHSLKEESGALNEATSCYENDEMQAYLKGWSDLVKANPGSQLWIWEYTINFRDTYAPFPNIYALAEDIRYYYDLGVNGIYLQNTDRLGGHNTEYNDLRIYLLSTLLRDPEADIEKETEFFLHEYYGDAGEYMKEILDIQTAQCRRHNVGPNCLCPGSDEIYRGNIWLNSIWLRDYRMEFLVPVSRMYNNDYPAGMDAHNRMTDSDVAAVDDLYAKALAAVEENSIYYYHVDRTMVGWRCVKSVMKVAEFADAGMYLQRNRELYDDMFNKYHCYCMRLINTSKPSGTDDVLNKTPDRWVPA